MRLSPRLFMLTLYQKWKPDSLKWSKGSIKHLNNTKLKRQLMNLMLHVIKKKRNH